MLYSIKKTTQLSDNNKHSSGLVRACVISEYFVFLIGVQLVFFTYTLVYFSFSIF